MLRRCDSSDQGIILELHSLKFLTLYSFVFNGDLSIFLECIALFFKFFGSIHVMAILTMEIVDLLDVILGLFLKVTQ